MGLWGIASQWAGPLAALVTALVTLYVRAELADMKLAASVGRSADVAELKQDIADMRLHFAERLAEDKQEIRNWINGSFMRAAVVEGQWKDTTRRLDDVTRRLERLEG